MPCIAITLWPKRWIRHFIPNTYKRTWIANPKR
ncbi:hypothetical protein T4C_648 [Trichinella pseudospiralis]|uniref:Uncharacterized protein n=1 Tax=Trichinella pseudospiralis TaxID=6337 RepID=A0A0V1GCC0_TRIPS|nr:hypothetical protein T4C_648 [Trichinella pseudospiralis]